MRVLLPRIPKILALVVVLRAMPMAKTTTTSPVRLTAKSFASHAKEYGFESHTGYMSKAPERCLYCDGTGSCDGFLCGFCDEGRPLDTQEDWDTSWGKIEMETDEARDARFAPGNDKVWGEGNWIKCSVCEHDSKDREVYHHKDAHGS